MFLPHPRVKVSIVGSLREREVACSASDRQGSNFESCVWRTVLSQSSHHPQEVLLAQFSLYVHKGGIKPDSFHFICIFRLGLSKIQIMFTFYHGFLFYRALLCGGGVRVHLFELIEKITMPCCRPFKALFLIITNIILESIQ